MVWNNDYSGTVYNKWIYVHGHFTHYWHFSLPLCGSEKYYVVYKVQAIYSFWFAFQTYLFRSDIYFVPDYYLQNHGLKCVCPIQFFQTKTPFCHSQIPCSVESVDMTLLQLLIWTTGPADLPCDRGMTRYLGSNNVSSNCSRILMVIF